jgi:hypothetical protein
MITDTPPQVVACCKSLTNPSFHPLLLRAGGLARGCKARPGLAARRAAAAVRTLRGNAAAVGAPLPRVRARWRAGPGYSRLGGVAGRVEARGRGDGRRCHGLCSVPAVGLLPAAFPCIGWVGRPPGTRGHARC